MITLYQYEISPFCDKVRRALALKGQAYEVREVTLAETGMGKLKRLSEGAKLPVIEHEGRRIGDSTDILAYLEGRFPDPPLYPSEPRERALAHVLEDWADEALYFYEMYLRFNVPHNRSRWLPALTKFDAPALRVVARVVVPTAIRRQLAAQGLGKKPLATVVRELDRHLEALDALLEGGSWLVGERICAADLAIFAQLYCIRGSDEGARALEALPRVTDWMRRVDEATRA
ncbi:MAG: glutathione S-transferase family protein [Myxococcales bacterium]|nr:glutathione S-transferase family protein [Myxococcales bacterium]